MARTVVLNNVLVTPGTRNFGPVPVPAGASKISIEIDVADMLDPTSRYDAALEVSTNGGATWSFLVGCARTGGPGANRLGEPTTHSGCSAYFPAAPALQLRGWVTTTGPSWTTTVAVETV